MIFIFFQREFSLLQQAARGGIDHLSAFADSLFPVCSCFQSISFWGSWLKVWKCLLRPLILWALNSNFVFLTLWSKIFLHFQFLTTDFYLVSQLLILQNVRICKQLEEKSSKECQVYFLLWSSFLQNIGPSNFGSLGIPELEFGSPQTMETDKKFQTNRSIQLQNPTMQINKCFKDHQ